MLLNLTCILKFNEKRNELCCSKGRISGRSSLMIWEIGPIFMTKREIAFIKLDY